MRPVRRGSSILPRVSGQVKGKWIMTAPAGEQSTTDNGATQPPQSQASQGNQQQQQTTVPAQQQQSHNGRGPGQEILDALNALPERIVNSLREGLQQTQQGHSGNQATNQGSGTSSAATDSEDRQGKAANSAQNGTADKGSSKQGNSSHTEPGKKSFAQWWFG